jgi:threonine dehydratase
MFHYRNHGAAFARVLVGFQVPQGDRGKLAEFFARTLEANSIYSYWDETENPAYRLFLAAS